MEPLTEQRPVSGPVVYGFLRLVRVPVARQAALIASLAEYCRGHELQLCGVFADGGNNTAAFTGLLDVLALPDVYGVVVPSRSHLGPQGMAAERGQRIEGAGARLLMVRRDLSTRSAGRRVASGSVQVLGAES
ncbi:hypothetical protein [Streptomyces sp. NPDC002785]|uniref:hypothetical protein n=1 Tax=Streptomyces sp. NPDC002785 TaxID=3154543 RepID=UPI003318A52E